MQALMQQSEQTALQMQELVRSLQQSNSSGSQTVSDLAAAMTTYAEASAGREQQLIEAITEAHKLTGEGIASSHSLFTQEVQS